MGGFSCWLLGFQSLDLSVFALRWNGCWCMGLIVSIPSLISIIFPCHHQLQSLLHLLLPPDHILLHQHCSNGSYQPMPASPLGFHWHSRPLWWLLLWWGKCSLSHWGQHTFGDGSRHSLICTLCELLCLQIWCTNALIQAYWNMPSQLEGLWPPEWTNHNLRVWSAVQHHQSSLGVDTEQQS